MSKHCMVLNEVSSVVKMFTCHIFDLITPIMLTFYRAAIESVLTFSIIVWLGTITVKESSEWAEL